MNKNYKRLIALLLICIMGILAFTLVACSKNGDNSEEPGDTEITEDGEPIDPDDPTTKDYDNGIYFEEEEEDADITLKDADKSEFIGSWKATSGSAAYYYGKVEITVKEDGTWEGNITDELLSGTWEEQGQGLYLTSDIFNCTLNFSSSGNLLMHEVYEEDDYDSGVVVLSKVE